MPKIEIETCRHTPNYCALEAVATAIRNNYTRRAGGNYQHEQVVKVSSGRELVVKETPLDANSESPCDSKFSVSVKGK